MTKVARMIMSRSMKVIEDDPALASLLLWVEQTLEQINQQIQHEETKESYDPIR